MDIHETLGRPLGSVAEQNKKIGEHNAGKHTTIESVGDVPAEILKEATDLAMRASVEWSKLPAHNTETGEQRVVLISKFRSLKDIEALSGGHESAVKVYFEKKLREYEGESEEGSEKRKNLYKLLRNEMRVIFKDVANARRLYDTGV